MGKLIDADKIMDKMQSTFDMQELYLPIHFKELIIDDMPSIEVIPKADYEARLKADMVAMLTEIQLEIEKKATEICDDGWWLTYNWLIQQKINELKGDQKRDNG